LWGSITIILGSGNTEDSAHLSYLVVMDFLVNVIKNIGCFCARKPRAFFRISFSSDSKASRFSIALISSGDLPD
ncbi:hypothetical protein, partial [Lactiplantibacillus plantarum]|uniref:hypothetical protein n=1 Tax=Lactiplantibacillus plantarum TaxID=1590 RepID=UPI0020A747B7